MLGGGMSSRLFTEVRERNGLAYYVFAHHAAYADTGTLFSQAGVDTDRIDLAVTTILKEFRAMASEPVGEDELRRVKNYLKGRMVLQLEDSRGLITFGLRREVLENRLAEPSEVLDGIEAVTVADVQRVAEQIMVQDALNFGLGRSVRRRESIPGAPGRVARSATRSSRRAVSPPPGRRVGDPAVRHAAVGRPYASRSG